MPMKLKFILTPFLICYFFFLQIYAQKKSILLDFQGVADNQSTLIIKTLAQLQDIDSKQPIFSQVMDLGTFQNQA